MNIEMDQIIVSLVGELRGPRSRQQLAQLLHVDKSTIYNWETGKSKPGWEHVNDLFELNGVSVNEILKQRFEKNETMTGSALLKYFVDHLGLDLVSRQASLQQASVKKIIVGSQQPKAEVVLSVLFKVNPRAFFYLIESSVGLKKIPQLEDFAKKWEFECEISEKFPFIAGVIYILERGLKKYEAIQRIQKAFELEKFLVLDLIEKLIKVDIIEEKNGRMYQKGKHWFDSGFDYSLFKPIHKYWASHALEKLPNSRDTTRSVNFAYSLLSVNEQGHRELIRAYSHFLDKVKLISDNSHPPLTRTFAVTLQVVDVEK